MLADLHRPHRPAPRLTRVLWVCVALTIVYLSLYPLEGWRLRQPSAFSWLAHGLPRHFSQADLVSNVAAYLVFGLLFQLAWFGQTRTVGPVLLTILAGCGLSFTLESLQSFLPTRVPSLLDLLSNTAGAAIGGLLGYFTAHSRIRRAPRLLPVSAIWYRQGPALGWVLLVVWLIGQLTPQRVLFSTGSLLTALAERSAVIAGWLAAPASAPMVAASGSPSPPIGLAPLASGGLIETLAITAMIVMVGVLVLDLIRPAVSRFLCLAALLALALALRALVQPGAGDRTWLSWLTSGAQAALLLSAACLHLVAAFGRRTRLWIGLALVPVTIVLTHLASADPYYLSTLRGARGMLDPAMTASLRSLIRGLGNCWPLFLGAYCVARLTTLGGDARRASL